MSRLRIRGIQQCRLCESLINAQALERETFGEENGNRTGIDSGTTLVFRVAKMQR